MSASRNVGEKYWFKGLPFKELRAKDDWGEKYWRKGRPSQALLPSSTPILLPSAIGSGEAFGTPAIICGPVEVAPSSIASSETFGTPRLTLKIVPTGIESEEAVGTPKVTPGKDPHCPHRNFEPGGLWGCIPVARTDRGGAGRHSFGRGVWGCKINAPGFPHRHRIGRSCWHP